MISMWHGTQQSEKALLDLVRSGDVRQTAELHSHLTFGVVGKMSQDMTHQLRYAGIVATALVSRAAVESGVSYEGAMTLSDYYCQLFDACKTEAELAPVMMEMVEMFTRRVNQCRAATQISPLVYSVREYIRSHITEAIKISQIASALGYTDYYLSTRYYQDCGEKINQTIKKEKTEQAKFLLATTTDSISEIAGQLSFSTHSYFSATFKAVTGMSPAEYREKVIQR